MGEKELLEKQAIEEYQKMHFGKQMISRINA
jgi:hypothetical protein